MRKHPAIALEGHARDVLRFVTGEESNQGGVMVGNLIADQFKGTGANWPLGAALAFLIMALLVAVYLVTTRVLRWVTRL